MIVVLRHQVTVCFALFLFVIILYFGNGVGDLPNQHVGVGIRARIHIAGDAGRRARTDCHGGDHQHLAAMLFVGHARLRVSVLYKPAQDGGVRGAGDMAPLNGLSHMVELGEALPAFAVRHVAILNRVAQIALSEMNGEAAEAEGIDKVFKNAGFEWREPGCSLCFNAGGEGFGPEQRVVTSTNRNFRGRQGRKTRSHLASPASVAAAAIEGRVCDVREAED